MVDYSRVFKLTTTVGKKHCLGLFKSKSHFKINNQCCLVTINIALEQKMI